MIISLPELLGQRELKIEVAKLGATLAELREQRAESFRFAREKDEPQRKLDS
jgi:hypothetical protein